MMAANMDEQQKQKLRKERISSIALGESIKYGIGATILAGAATVLASYKNKNFMKFMSISAKTSIPTMAGLGMFGYKYETVQYDAMQNPGNWGLEKYVEKGIVTKMPIHHRAMNYLYDHPFYFVSFVGFPFAAYILKSQMKLTHLTLSQKIMHSRVFAQGGVLMILLITMGFTGYMDKRGRFPEPLEEGQVVKAEEETVNYGVKDSNEAHARKRN
jgi:hypothetical protein